MDLRMYHPDDILVKVLLNEDEAHIPVETDCAPYYHWKDVRPYLMQRINAFKPYVKPEKK